MKERNVLDQEDKPILLTVEQVAARKSPEEGIRKKTGRHSHISSSYSHEKV